LYARGKTCTLDKNQLTILRNILFIYKDAWQGFNLEGWWFQYLCILWSSITVKVCHLGFQCGKFTHISNFGSRLRWDAEQCKLNLNPGPNQLCLPEWWSSPALQPVIAVWLLVSCPTPWGDHYIVGLVPVQSFLTFRLLSPGQLIKYL